MSTVDPTSGANPTVGSTNAASRKESFGSPSSDGSSKFKSFLPQATLSDLVSLMSPVDLSLSTILSNPTPLVGLVSQDSLPPCVSQEWDLIRPLSKSHIEDVLKKQLRPVANKNMNLLSLSLAEPLPPSKPTRTTYEGYLPQGLIRYDWIHKHTACIPELVLFCFEYIYGLPLQEQEQEWLKTYNSFLEKNSTRAPRALVAVFLPEQIARLHTRIVLKDKDRDRGKDMDREKVDDSEEEAFLTSSAPAPTTSSSFPSFSTTVTVEQQLSSRAVSLFKRIGVDSKRILILPVQSSEDLSIHLSSVSDSTGAGMNVSSNIAPPMVAVNTHLGAGVRVQARGDAQ